MNATDQCSCRKADLSFEQRRQKTAVQDLWRTRRERVHTLQQAFTLIAHQGKGANHQMHQQSAADRGGDETLCR